MTSENVHRSFEYIWVNIQTYFHTYMSELSPSEKKIEIYGMTLLWEEKTASGEESWEQQFCPLFFFYFRW